jgi:hypothetical protein
MNAVVTDAKDQVLDARALTDEELDEVNGGLFFLVAGAILALEAGMLGGAIAANYHYTGNFWGDLPD